MFAIAKYRTIQTNYWNDPYVETLPPEGRAFYIYLMTSSHTSNVGVLEISHARMAFETGWSVETVEKILKRLEADGKITTDQNYVLVNNFIKNQTNTSPKMLSNLKEYLQDITSTKILHTLSIRYPSLKIELNEVGIPYGYPIDTVSIPYGYPTDTLPIPPREKERELEEEKELELELEGEKELELERELEGEMQKGEPSSTAGAVDACPHGKIISLFAEILPELPVVKVMSETRKKTLRARWREDKERQNLDWWRDYFLRVKASDFLMGRVPSREGKAPFMATFDWLINPQNMAKTVEGNYANRASPPAISGGARRYERPLSAAEQMRAMADRIRAEAEGKENSGIIGINTGGGGILDVGI